MLIISYAANVLKRCMDADGVTFYVSEKLQSAGVKHAFSTRLGGISPAPFDSLNLGNPSGSAILDDYDRIWANYARLLRAINGPTDPPLRVHQVHGAAVARVDVNCPFDVSACADALISQDVLRAISVRTADCLPVLIATPDGRTVAAVHAGWRGIIAGVIPATIDRTLAIDQTHGPADFIAALGPCIGPEAFEVGTEVLTAFENAFGNDAPIRRTSGGKRSVDLSRSARLQLLAAGLSETRIEWTDRCTVTHQTEFFSHRRGNGVTGRMAAVILPTAS